MLAVLGHIGKKGEKEDVGWQNLDSLVEVMEDRKMLPIQGHSRIKGCKNDVGSTRTESKERRKGIYKQYWGIVEGNEKRKMLVVLGLVGRKEREGVGCTGICWKERRKEDVGYTGTC